MISIASQTIKKITYEAKKAYPDECCGLLAGIVSLNGAVTITQLRPSTNVAKATNRRNFEIDPKVHFDLIHELRGTKERIIGHYHSHPNYPARPSEKDLKRALDPQLLWLIISLDESRINEVKLHQLNDKTATFYEVPLLIIEKSQQ